LLQTPTGQSADKAIAVNAIELPARSNTPMRHNLGAYRLQLKNLLQPVDEGDRIELKLNFETAGSVAVQVYMQAAPEGAATEHKH
jgi:copper(I)-binding protein